MFLGDSNEQSIICDRDKKSNQWSSVYYKTYSIHNSNIKYVDSTIKYIDFESFYYVINLDVVLSFMVFNDFDYVFLSMYFLLIH